MGAYPKMRNNSQMNVSDFASMSVDDIIAFASGETTQKPKAKKQLKKVNLPQEPIKNVPLSKVKGSRRVIDNRPVKNEEDYSDFYVRQIPSGQRIDKVGIAIKKALKPKLSYSTPVAN